MQLHKITQDKNGMHEKQLIKLEMHSMFFSSNSMNTSQPSPYPRSQLRTASPVRAGKFGGGMPPYPKRADCLDSVGGLDCPRCTRIFPLGALHIRNITHVVYPTQPRVMSCK